MLNETDFNNFDEIFKDFSISMQESIKNIVKQEGYIRPRVEMKIVPQAGNFLSFLYEVDVTGETTEGKKVKVTSLFIKKSVKLDKITVAKVSDLYARELFIYNDLSQVFSRLQDAANVPDKERFRFIKKYNSDNDCVIMENLSKEEFKIYNKTQVLPLKFAELSIVQLAKFHALSYVIKKRIPKYFDDKVRVMGNCFNVDNDFEGLIRNICTVIVQVVNGDARAKIANFAPRMIQTYQKFFKDIMLPNGCLCHGDYKFLNIMVKEVNGQIAVVQPIDYQLVYYGSPVDDFLFFMFTSTDRGFRKTHMSSLKELYFESFAKFLNYFSVDVNSAYSRREFEDDYEDRLELGLVFGLYLAAFTFAHVEEGFDVQKMSLSELQIIPDEMFTERVKGIVEDYIDWGYL